MAHILLVEDSPEVSLTVREILQTAGHTVEDAASGTEAIKCLKASKFDMIVSDIWMPGMDGIALLKEIRGAGNEIPVVVISGGAPNAPLTYTAPLAATFGANAVVYKPFEKAELLKAVDTVLSMD
jgi:CheY-like chemotaxis protein